MDLFIQQVVSGFATGGIYACMALSVVMIYQAIHHLNFAQGEMAMFSTYIAWQLLAWGLPYWAVFPLVIAISFVGGFAVERIVFKPIENAPVLSLLRGFSAPVRLEHSPPLDDATLAFLASHDTDAFNKWEASFKLATGVVLELDQRAEHPPAFAHVWRRQHRLRRRSQGDERRREDAVGGAEAADAHGEGYRGRASGWAWPGRWRRRGDC